MKIDGTFFWSGSGGYDLIVNHQNVTQAEYDAACEAQDNKPDVTWHEFAVSGIKQYFSD